MKDDLAKIMAVSKICHSVFGIGNVRIGESLGSISDNTWGICIGFVLLFYGAVVANYASRVLSIMIHTRKVCGSDQLAQLVFDGDVRFVYGIKLCVLGLYFSLVCLYLSTAAYMVASAFDPDVIYPYSGAGELPDSYYWSLSVASAGALPFLFADNFFAAFPRTIGCANVVVFSVVIGLFGSAIVSNVSGIPPCTQRPDDPQEEDSWQQVQRLFTVIPTVIFVSVGDQACVYIFESLPSALQRDRRNWTRINNVAYTVVFCTSVITGLLGTVFSDRSLDVACTDPDAFTKFLRVSYSAQLVLSTPLGFNIMRDYILGMLWPEERYDPMKDTDTRVPDHLPSKTGTSLLLYNDDGDVLPSLDSGRGDGDGGRERTLPDSRSFSLESGSWPTQPSEARGTETPLLTFGVRKQSIVTGVLWVMVVAMCCLSSEKSDLVKEGVASVCVTSLLIFTFYFKFTLNTNDKKVDGLAALAEENEGSYEGGGSSCEEGSYTRAFSDKIVGQTREQGRGFLCGVAWRMWLPIDDDQSFFGKLQNGAYVQDVVLLAGIGFLLAGYCISFLDNNDSNQTIVINALLGASAMFTLLKLCELCGARSPAERVSQNIREGSMFMYDHIFSRPSMPLAGLSSTYCEDGPMGSEDNMAGAALLPEETNILTMKEIEISESELTWKRNIAAGQFGIVSKRLYKGQIVAVKEIHIGDTPAQWNAEIRTLVKLRWPGVVAFHGICFSDESTVLLVMEYVEHNLFNAVRNEQYTAAHFRSWAVSICRTMEWLHGKGVIHRDLKPQNVLVANFDLPQHGSGALQSGVKICDFGFARLQDPAESRGAVSTLGTPIFMPPEVLKMRHRPLKKPYDGYKFDVYSFGMVLYYMWARKLPFNGRASELEIASGKVKPDVSQLHSSATSNFNTTHKTSQGSSSQDTLGAALPLSNRIDPSGEKEALQLGEGSAQVLALMKRCWSSQPKHRPPFKDIDNALREATRFPGDSCEYNMSCAELDSQMSSVAGGSGTASAVNLSHVT
jgi:serine/threonine protein kinase